MKFVKVVNIDRLEDTLSHYFGHPVKMEVNYIINLKHYYVHMQTLVQIGIIIIEFLVDMVLLRNIRNK